MKETNDLRMEEIDDRHEAEREWQIDHTWQCKACGETAELTKDEVDFFVKESNYICINCTNINLEEAIHDAIDILDNDYCPSKAKDKLDNALMSALDIINL